MCISITNHLFTSIRNCFVIISSLISNALFSFINLAINSNCSAVLIQIYVLIILEIKSAYLIDNQYDTHLKYFEPIYLSVLEQNLPQVLQRYCILVNPVAVTVFFTLISSSEPHSGQLPLSSPNITP